MTSRVVLASDNPGKLRELSRMLRGSGFELVSQGDFDVSAVDEDGETFVENAIKKARNAARQTGLPAIADDSGLEVHALGGRPGIRSARFAGPGANDSDNVSRLLNEMQSLRGDERRARFVCVIVFMRHAADPVPIVCTGTWDGTILESPRGERGFGYDPVFLPNDRTASAAELAADDKNAISHRARALDCLTRALRA